MPSSFPLRRKLWVKVHLAFASLSIAGSKSSKRRRETKDQSTVHYCDSIAGWMRVVKCASSLQLGDTIGTASISVMWIVLVRRDKKVSRKAFP
jgi:hypothetical protein